MSTSAKTKVTEEYRSIPIAQLKESSTNPRKTFDEASLQELAESIRSKGVLLPLLVRPVNGHYQIVAGERRYRASKLAGATLSRRRSANSPTPNASKSS
jgi:ParB family transcriptional regulator, chromosome partitioning protein